MYWYRKVWKQFLDFYGRARRKEFWMFTLINFLTVPGYFIVALIIRLVIKGILATAYPSYYLEMETNRIWSMIMIMFVAPLFVAYWLAVIIPSLAVTVRRLHDTGRSGKTIFFGLIPFAGAIILLIYCAEEGKRGDNQYGPDPKTVEQQVKPRRIVRGE